mmetsp:Transcript_4905/g.12212  ORF Transcript_4905/g.12212 Transcript_4905/m.12212 type:complete len:206 (+) Transcript_4905:2301-2918(+)
MRSMHFKSGGMCSCFSKRCKVPQTPHGANRSEFKNSTRSTCDSEKLSARNSPVLDGCMLLRLRKRDSASGKSWQQAVATRNARPTPGDLLKKKIPSSASCCARFVAAAAVAPPRSLCRDAAEFAFNTGFRGTKKGSYRTAESITSGGFRLVRPERIDMVRSVSSPGDMPVFSAGATDLFVRIWPPLRGVTSGFFARDTVPADDGG